MNTRIRRGATLASVVALAVAGVAVGAPASAAGPYDDKVVIDSGHVDVLFAGEADGQATLTVHDDTVSPAAYRDPGGVVFHVKPSVAQRTANAFVASIPGFAQAGDTIYVLPQNNVPGTIFGGFGHSLPSGTSVEHSVTTLEAPGRVATWQTGDEGPDVFWNTAAGLPTSFTSPANHEHLNWGFTAPGEYVLGVETEVTRPDGTALPPVTGTYTFYVGEDLPADGGEEPLPSTTLTISGVSAHYHAGGVVNLTAVQEPDTGENHYHWFIRAPGETEWSVVQGAYGATYGFVARAEHDGLEVQARLYGAGHATIAESQPAVIVVDDHGNSPVEGPTISATLEETEGALVVSVPEENRDVVLSNFELSPAADKYVASGELGAIHVTDTRSDDPGWTLNGRVRSFTTVDGDQLAGANLGWAPEVLQAAPSQQVTAGASVAPLLSGGTGVQAWTPLASAAAGAGVGQAQIGAGLTLEAPLDLTPGTYEGLLILTVI
ncbi:TIGR03769 domain-containing protein [Cellulosimicrobium cellulans]|uniref:choice-of-anchor M domain-containing protein n=1 Tax=Cellulosimicrobium cellulans TaxID=1710 RepID=UPI001EDB6379|nr:choice-of-anchor M domain-containing protein [Cellulosimicrobium cellulans]UKJ63323.1 TIGR03769 domain-containing protein [Cellulosimicrobium cellulans]